MTGTIDFRALGAQQHAHAEKQLSDAAAKNSVNRDFYGAALIAKHSAQQDELFPAISEYGETRYSVQQGLKAACHAREDVTAILIIQQALLRRLGPPRFS